jgi:hypothetical protein
LAAKVVMAQVVMGQVAQAEVDLEMDLHQQ